MSGSWDDPEFVAAPDSPAASGGKYLKHKDVPTDANMILKYVERFQKDMTPDLKQKMEGAGGTVGPVYWVYYFDDITGEKEVKKEYSAFKKMTALTIAMKDASVEKGDTFTVRRVGEGYDTRFQIVKLTGGVQAADLVGAQASSTTNSTEAPF